ncbi:MAG: FAD-dependent oxidoreductase [Gammaproteobacteria bacterium]|nr:FAD-dependent oxidoreductase [Gammaproteobacteria bacterium]
MATKHSDVVVVGGGQAAAQLVDALVRQKAGCFVTLISEEPLLPYQRPPLSKQYLAGTFDTDWLLYRPPEFYEGHAVDVRLGCRVVAISRKDQTVQLDDGTSIGYAQLALATGCRARTLQVPGADVERVHYLRTLGDVDRIRVTIKDARRILIIGGGFIGLEVAAVLVRLGHEVTVLEGEDRVLPRVVAPVVSDFFRTKHAQKGVKIVTGVKISEIREDRSGALSIHCGAGYPFPADAIIVGIGVLPNVELATDCGLECDNGIVVDEYACTTDPAIVAAGDCTNHPNALLGKSVRLETVHNAIEQAKTAAASLCGRNIAYKQTPWVWSDQYDSRLHSVGTSAQHDQHVLRGDPKSGSFSVFYFRGSRFIGVNCVNRALDFGACRRILNECVSLSAEQASDPTLDLRKLLGPGTRLAFERPWPPREQRVRPLLPDREATNDVRVSGET